MNKKLISFYKPILNQSNLTRAPVSTSGNCNMGVPLFAVLAPAHVTSLTDPQPMTLHMLHLYLTNP